MKGKLFILALAVAAFVLIVSAPEASAEYEIVAYDYGGYSFSLDTSDHTADLLEMLDSETDPVIPDVVPYQEQEYKVTSVDWGVFSEDGIKTVTLGKYLKEVDPGAFSSNTLEAFIEPATLDPSSPFYVTDGVLCELDVDKDINGIVRYPAAKAGTYYDVAAPFNTISEGAFRGSLNLQEIHISSVSIVIISTDAFSECRSLVKFNYDTADGYNHLPNNALIVENSAFYGCTSLGNFKMPDKLRIIEPYAFYGCGFQTFYLNQDINSIGSNAFSNCQNLTKFDYDYYIYTNRGGFAFDSNVLYEENNGKKTILCYPGGITDTSYTVKDDFDDIDIGAFSNNKHLTEVTLNSKITELKYGAFSECTSLKKVVVTKNLKTIGTSVFDGCTSLDTIEGWTNITDIGSFSFQGTGFTEITLPESVTSVGIHAFSDSKLVRVTVPDVRVTILSGAFIGCMDLKDIYFEGDRMELDAGSMNVGTDEEHIAEFTVHIISTANIPSDAVDDEFTKMHIDKEGEHPYPYENFIGVAICLLALFGVVMVIREV